MNAEWLYRAEALALITMKTGISDPSEMLEAASRRGEVRMRNRHRPEALDDYLNVRTWVDALEDARHDEFHDGDLRNYLGRLTGYRPNRGGRPELPEWEQYEKELRNKLRRDGVPKGSNPKAWRTIQDAAKFLETCFVRDGKEVPDNSVCREHARKVIAEFLGKTSFP